MAVMAPEIKYQTQRTDTRLVASVHTPRAVDVCWTLRSADCVVRWNELRSAASPMNINAAVTKIGCKTNA